MKTKTPNYRFKICCTECGFVSGCMIETDAKNGAIEHSRLCGEGGAKVDIYDGKNLILTARWLKQPSSNVFVDQSIKSKERTALQFYATESNWFGAPAPVYTDSGTIARTALKP